MQRRRRIFGEEINISSNRWSHIIGLKERGVCRNRTPGGEAAISFSRPYASAVSYRARRLPSDPRRCLSHREGFPLSLLPKRREPAHFGEEATSASLDDLCTPTNGNQCRNRKTRFCGQCEQQRNSKTKTVPPFHGKAMSIEAISHISRDIWR